MAAPAAAASAQALRRLHDLLGGAGETAQLCGLTTTAVRDILAVGQVGQVGGFRR
jgi:hypothetical protein